MYPKTVTFVQLFTRVAISFSFLSAVADRFGWWGAPGSKLVSWGNWQNFVSYCNAVNSFVPAQTGEILAIIATVAEIILSLLLLTGFKLRLAAIASGILLLIFALAMSISFGIKAPLNYSVWSASAACFLLSTVPFLSYSLDNVFSKKQ